MATKREQQEQAKQLKAQGKSVRQIAATIGKPKSTIADWLQIPSDNPKTSNIPPGAGFYALPSIQQQIAIWNSGLAKVFKNPDSAFISDKTAAEAMLTDLNIEEPLTTRMLGTALLPWYIKPRNKEDKEQREAAKVLQGAMQETPRLTQMFYNLLWAVWYGSYGVQYLYKFRQRMGRRCLLIDDHSPVHGDSIRWRWDCPGEYGIMTYPSYLGEGTRKVNWQATDLGPYMPIEGAIKERFVIHRHIQMAAQYFQGERAGLSQGVGLRNFCWWSYSQKQWLLGILSEYLERHGAGNWMAKYPMGNAAFQQAAETALRTMDYSQVLSWPVHPEGEDLGGIEQIAPNSSGINDFLKIIDYFNLQIRRYISGLDLKGDQDVTVIGEDTSKENALAKIVKFDSLNLADTITHQLLPVLVRWTFPEAEEKGWQFEFCFTTDNPDVASWMQGVKLAYDMGVTIDEDELRNNLKLTRPVEGAPTLKQPEQGQGQAPTNPFGGQGGATPQLPNPGRTEGEWQEGTGEEGGDLMFNLETGKVRYTKEDELEQFAAEDWVEEKAPRAKSGRRWRNKKTNSVTYKDPTQAKAKPDKGAQEQTIKKATAAFTDKDKTALDAVASDLRQAKGKRGGLGVAGLQAIARAVGIKGRFKKDQLIEALLEKLGVAAKEAPQSEFKQRIEKAKEAQARTGTPFLDRLANTILLGRNDEEYRAALNDIEAKGRDEKGKPLHRSEAEATLKAKRKGVIDQLINEASPETPTKELTHALKQVAQYGDLTPAEAIDLAIEGGNLDKISPPDKPKGGILPDELTLAPKPRERKPLEPRKKRDYIDHVLRPVKARERQIKTIEAKTKTPYLARIVNKVITDHILSPDARSTFEKLRAKVKSEGIEPDKLPEKEARFYKDYEAGQRYQHIQTKLANAKRKNVDYTLSGDEVNFLKGYRGAIASRIAFEDGLTFGVHDLDHILTDLDAKGYGALKVPEVISKFKRLNPHLDRDKYSKGGK